MDADMTANTADERALDERELLEQSIEQHASELREAVDDLTAAVKQELTLGGRIAAHPARWLLGAFLVGMWLGRSE